MEEGAGRLRAGSDEPSLRPDSQSRITALDRLVNADMSLYTPAERGRGGLTASREMGTRQRGPREGYDTTALPITYKG